MSFWALEVGDAKVTLDPVERSFRIERAICEYDYRKRQLTLYAKQSTMVCGAPIAIFPPTGVVDKPIGITFKKGDVVSFYTSSFSYFVHLVGHYLDEEVTPPSESEELFTKWKENIVRNHMERGINGLPVAGGSDQSNMAANNELTKMAATIESLREEVKQLRQDILSTRNVRKDQGAFSGLDPFARFPR